jgi:hypothetical protein
LVYKLQVTILGPICLLQTKSRDHHQTLFQKKTILRGGSMLIRYVGLSIYVALVITLASLITADVPQLVNYQGRLTDSEGSPVADDTYEVTFRIYDELSIERWSETHNIETVGGLFSVQLGSGSSPLDASVLDYTECWLGLTITGEDEITPRTQLIATPYAYRISTVDGASGGIISGDITVQGNLAVTGDVQVAGDVVGATPWTAFPFAAGYNDYEDSHPGDGHQRVQYRKIGDIVYIRGLIHRENHGAIPGGALFGTLPPGFRPPALRSFFVDPYGGIYVMPSGDVVTPPGSPNEYMALNVIFSTSP